MPSSWSESNRMHSTNQREESAEDMLNDFANDAPDDSYLDDPFPEYDYEEPPDHYLDAAYEDRYYIDEPPEFEFGY